MNKYQIRFNGSWSGTAWSLTNITYYNDVGEVVTNTTSATQYSLAEGVTAMGYACFMDCPFLVSITLPSTITSIESNCFTNCTSLTTVVIPNNVLIINPFSFKNCTSLNYVLLPNKITYISEACFVGCTSLSSITIPNTVTRLSVSSFDGCTSLSNISLSDNITTINDFCFRGCTSLENIIIPVGVSVLPVGCFDGCSSLTNVIIYSKMTEILEYCFRGCTSLIKILTSLNYVDDLKSVMGVNNPDAVPLIEGQLFWFKTVLEDNESLVASSHSDVIYTNEKLGDNTTKTLSLKFGEMNEDYSGKTDTNTWDNFLTNFQTFTESEWAALSDEEKNNIPTAYITE